MKLSTWTKVEVEAQQKPAGSVATAVQADDSTACSQRRGLDVPQYGGCVLTKRRETRASGLGGAAVSIDTAVCAACCDALSAQLLCA
ncbi:hypothetical protein ACOMHN_017439 [Nucella lapillus]